MTLNATLAPRLQTLIDKKIPNRGAKTRLHAIVARKTALQQAELVRLLEKEALAGEKEPTLMLVSTLYDDVTRYAPTMSAVEASHTMQMYGETHHASVGKIQPGRPLPRVYSRHRVSDLAVLKRLRARVFMDEGHTEQASHVYAKAIVFPPGWEQALQQASAPSSKREAPRLTRAKRNQIHDVISGIFGEAAYLCAFVRFLVELLIENGGRWEGLQYVRLCDVIPNLEDPVLLCGEEPASPNKPGIHWRIIKSRPFLLEMLRVHPELVDHPEAPNLQCFLFGDPYEERGDLYCDDQVMARIWHPFKAALKIAWDLGPRSFRVYHVTRRSASGDAPATIRTNIGQVTHGRNLPGYVRYEQDDLVDIHDHFFQSWHAAWTSEAPAW